MLAEIFYSFECLLNKTQLIKIHNSLDSSRPYGRLLKKIKKLGFMESENDFQTSSTVNFPKELPEFGDLETNQIHEIQTSIFFHILFYI